MGNDLITLDDPIEILPGLHRLGATVPTLGRLSWAPAQVVEPLPMNVYVALSDASALVIDTGVRALYPAMLDQITELVGDRELSVLVTRNDPEAMGGVGFLLPQLEPSFLFYYGGGSILEWVWDERGGPGAAGDLFDTTEVANPPEIELDQSRALRVFRTPLAVLNTVWAYDPQTRTLFTSDGLGYVAAASSGQVVDPAGDVDAQRAFAFLGARFDWVDRINSPRLADELRALLVPLEVDNLAPSHGVVVRGRAAVDRYLETVLGTLVPASVTPPA